MATVFLSHSSRNGELTRSLEAWLRANGFNDLFVDHGMRSGDKWAAELRAAKASCRLVLCLVTPEWLSSDECFGEFMAAFYLGRRIIPLFCMGSAELDTRQAQRLAKVRAEDQGADLSQAGAPDALDLDAAPHVAEPLKAGLRAAGALVDVGLDPRAFEVDPARRPEPFPGLESFGDDDADAAIFFGRDTAIAQCLEDLREMRASADRRAYAVLGASGSGKSSLMKAGVAPRLRRERGWLVLRAFRPGADPLLAFADAIARTGADHQQALAPGAVRDSLLKAWRDGADLAAALAEALAPIRTAADRPDATVVIVVDQGEELARHGQDRGQGADALAAYLAAAASAPAPAGEPAPYVVAMTVRSDSFAEVQASPRLAKLTMRLADVRPLPFSRLAIVIEQPAARYGVLIEPSLVEALADDASDEASLPLLAFALQRLWRQYHVARRIVRDNYESVGKLSGLIDDAAERALRGIDPAGEQPPIGDEPSVEREKRASRVFVPALAQINDAGEAIRRVARLDRFDDQARKIIGDFDRWRLLVVDGEHAEVAHEAMFQEWPRFQQWLAPEKERLQALRGVEQAAGAWRARGRKAQDLVHRGKRLGEARALDAESDYARQLDDDPDARDYLAAATAAQGRRRLWAGLGGIGAALVVGVLGFLAYRSYEHGVTQATYETLMRNEGAARDARRFRNYDRAIDLHEANVGLAQRLIAREPLNARWRYDLALEHTMVAFSLMTRNANGDQAAALAEYVAAQNALGALPATPSTEKDVRAGSAFLKGWLPGCIAGMRQHIACKEPGA